MRWCVPDDALYVGTSFAAKLAISLGRLVGMSVISRDEAMRLLPWR